MLIGRATRLTEYLIDATKAYEATIELGVTTDTYDSDGEVTSRAGASGVTGSQVDAALAGFRGEIMQAPPAYSAIKRAGVPLYKRARRGELVEPEPRPVRVLQLDITGYETPVLGLHVECGKGFYVRSLAHDLGAALGVGGTLTGLRRSRVGSFKAEDAVDIETLRAEFEAGTWHERLYAPDEVLLGWDAAILGAENAGRLCHGQAALLVQPASSARRPDALCRAYSHEGVFLGIARIASPGRLEPEKMFV